MTSAKRKPFEVAYSKADDQGLYEVDPWTWETVFMHYFADWWGETVENGLAPYPHRIDKQGVPVPIGKEAQKKLEGYQARDVPTALAMGQALKFFANRGGKNGANGADIMPSDSTVLRMLGYSETSLEVLTFRQILIGLGFIKLYMNASRMARTPARYRLTIPGVLVEEVSEDDSNAPPNCRDIFRQLTENEEEKAPF